MVAGLVDEEGKNRSSAWLTASVLVARNASRSKAGFECELEPFLIRDIARGCRKTGAPTQLNSSPFVVNTQLRNGRLNPVVGEQDAYAADPGLSASVHHAFPNIDLKLSRHRLAVSNSENRLPSCSMR